LRLNIRLWQSERRKQYSTESPEKYAAELKRLYDKAYRNRDNKTRQEDLIQTFLYGLQDYKARIHIELDGALLRFCLAALYK
jgi:hypothetical protein